MKKALFTLVFTAVTTLLYAQAPPFIWAKNIKTGIASGYGIAVDSAGNTYTTGNFNDTVDFDPGPGVYKMSSIKGAAFILKLDANGNFVWVRKLDGPSGDGGHCITIDATGNVIVTGFFVSNATINAGSGTYSISGSAGPDIFVLKLDSAGELLWVKSFSGPHEEWVHAVKTDSSGNIYFTGSFRMTVDFDPGPGTFYITATCEREIFLVKLSTSGNLLWAKSMAGTATAVASGEALELDDTANVFLAGGYSRTVDFDPGSGTHNKTAADGGLGDIFVAKFDSAGHFKWVKSIGGRSEDRSLTLTLDVRGNIYTAGVFHDTVDFDPGSGTYNLAADPVIGDIFITKLNSRGDWVWAKRIGGDGVDEPRAITVAGEDLYITGFFSNTVDFDPGAGVYDLNASPRDIQDIFMCKLDTTGGFSWAVSIGGKKHDYGGDIITYGPDIIYTTGSFTATADFDPGIDTAILTAGGNSDMFVLKLGTCNRRHVIIDVSGTVLFSTEKAITYQWVRCPDYTPIPGAVGRSYIPDRTGDYAVILNNGGCMDTSACIHRLNVVDPSQQGVVSIYPNPATDRISISLPEMQQNVSIRIINITGTTVLFQEQLNGKEFMTDISNLRAGVYFIQVFAAKILGIQKIIKT